ELAGGHARLLDFDLAQLAASVGDGEALVAYRCYARTTIEAGPPARESSVQSLCAFVLRSRSADDDRPGAEAARLERIDLGPMEPIESAVRAWRDALGSSAGRGIGVSTRDPTAGLVHAGVALRQLVL